MPIGSRRKLYPISPHHCVIACCLYISCRLAFASSGPTTWRVTVWWRTILVFARWNHNHRNKRFPSTSLIVLSTIISSGWFFAKNCSLAVFISSLIFLFAKSPVVSSPLHASQSVYFLVRSTRLLYPCSLKYLQDSFAPRSSRGVMGNPGNARGAAKICPQKISILTVSIDIYFKKRIERRDNKQGKYTKIDQKN